MGVRTEASMEPAAPAKRLAALGERTGGITDPDELAYAAAEQVRAILDRL
jgi:hypothetical protein